MSIQVPRCRYEGKEESLKQLLCKEKRSRVSAPYPLHPRILPPVEEAFDSAVEQIKPPAPAIPPIKPNDNIDNKESLASQRLVTNSVHNGEPFTPIKGDSSFQEVSHLDRCYTSSSPFSSSSSEQEHCLMDETVHDDHVNGSVSNGREESVMTSQLYLTPYSDQEGSYLTANDETISAHLDLNTAINSESAFVPNDDDINDEANNTDLNADLNTDSVLNIDLNTDSSVFHSSQVNEPYLPIDTPAVPMPPMLSIESIDSTASSSLSCTSCDPFTEAPVADPTDLLDHLESSIGMGSSCTVQSLPSPSVTDSTSCTGSGRRSSRKNRFKIAANFSFRGKENKPQNVTTPTLSMSLPSTFEAGSLLMAPPSIRATPPVRATPPLGATPISIQATPPSIRAILPAIRRATPSLIPTPSPSPSLVTSSRPKVPHQSLSCLMDPPPPSLKIRSHYHTLTPPTDTSPHKSLSSQSPASLLSPSPSLISSPVHNISPNAKKTLTPGKTLSIDTKEMDKKILEQEELLEKERAHLQKQISLYQKTLQEKTEDEDVDLSKQLDDDKCRLVDRVINANISKMATSFWNDEYRATLGNKAKKYDSSLLLNELKTEESLLKLQVELFS